MPQILIDTLCMIGLCAVVVTFVALMSMGFDKEYCRNKAAIYDKQQQRTEFVQEVFDDCMGEGDI